MFSADGVHSGKIPPQAFEQAGILDLSRLFAKSKIHQLLPHVAQFFVQL
ncbi:uncharacterized protein METZ01_LOCUS389884, partial [marine metagenome]